MKPWTAIAVALAAMALAVPPAARANEQLLAEKQCNQCHKAGEASKGPSWHSIAEKWKGRADAQARLTKTIQAGTETTPHWAKKMTMPDTSKRPTVNGAEAHEMIVWILAQ